MWMHSPGCLRVKWPMRQWQMRCWPPFVLVSYSNKSFIVGMALVTCIFFQKHNKYTSLNTSTMQSGWSKSSPHTDTQSPNSFPHRSVSETFCYRDQLHSFSLQFKIPQLFPTQTSFMPPPPRAFLSYSRLHSPAPAVPALQSLTLGFVLDFLNRPSLCSSFLLCLFIISPTPGGGLRGVGGVWGVGDGGVGWGGVVSQMCPWWLSLRYFLVRHDHS